MINPFNDGYYTEDELREFGFKAVGQNVRIAKNNVIIGLENIEIGNNVRIDDYCSLLAVGGYIKLGSYIHIGGYCYVAAGAGVIMDDFSGISQGCCLYSKSGDYTGKHMTNPTVPDEYTGVFEGEIHLCRHAVVGTGSVILPNVTLKEGASVGALSLVTRSLEGWYVYGGVPVKKIRVRSKELLKLEKEFLEKKKIRINVIQ